MKNARLLIALLAVSVFAAIGWNWQRSAADSKTTSSVDVREDGSSDIVKVEKKIPTLTQVHPQSVGNTTTYEDFEAQKACFDVADTSSNISKDIAELQAALPRARADSRTALENEIHHKEAQLAVLAKCDNAAITKDDLSKLLERAARQGDLAAQLAYAKDPMIDRSHSIENLDRLKAWRDSALAYVTASVDRGNSEAMLTLAGAYDPLQCQPVNLPFCSSEMLPQIVEPDAAEAYRYYYESKLIGKAPSWIDAELSTLEQYLTPEQIKTAQQAAQSALATL